jgi:hypothetical protein
MGKVEGEMNKRLLAELQRGPPGDAPQRGVAPTQSHRQPPPKPTGGSAGRSSAEADLTTSLLTRLVRRLPRGAGLADRGAAFR